MVRVIPVLVLMAMLAAQIHGSIALGSCRTFCGNITVDYPFGIDQGCGHPKYRDLLYCINNVMMLHISSGSYQVLNIDYEFRVLTMSDPKMSTCSSMHKSEGFVLEAIRSQYLQPTPDNAFMLLGCNRSSPLFQGFPDKHLPCQNVSGIGCDAFYDCPSWVGFGKKSKAKKPPPCCGVSYGAIGSVNLTHLQCYSYASAYNSAPLRASNPGDWSYGIQMSYLVPQDSDFCRSCEATRGVCGYDVSKENNLCLCDGWNSTSSCDTGNPSTATMHSKAVLQLSLLFAGLLLLSLN